MYTSTTEIYTYLHTLSLHDALPIWSALPLNLEFRLIRSWRGCNGSAVRFRLGRDTAEAGLHSANLRLQSIDLRPQGRRVTGCRRLCTGSRRHERQRRACCAQCRCFPLHRVFVSFTVWSVERSEELRLGQECFSTF